MRRSSSGSSGMPFASCPSKVTPKKRSAIDQALATPCCPRRSSAKRRTSRSTTGSSRSPRRLMKNIGAALHCRVPTRNRGESAATSSARAAEIQSTGRRNRGRAPLCASRAREPVSAIAAAPSAASAPASRTPETGTSTNGAAAADRRRQRARDPSPAEREVRPSCRQHHEECPDGGEAERKEARAMSPGIGPERPRLEASGGRQDAEARFGERLGQRRFHPREVRCVDEKPHAPAVLGEEPTERVGAPDDPLPGRLTLALALPSCEDSTRARFAARVDGDVEEASGSEDGTHAGDRRQPSLRQPQRFPVGGVVQIVDFDLDLGEPHEAEARPALLAAHHGRRMRGRPGEGVVGRARRTDHGQSHHQIHGQSRDRGHAAQSPSLHADPKLHEAWGLSHEGRCAGDGHAPFDLGL